MNDFFGVSWPAFSGQLVLGLVNGSFYAMLSLGLVVTFGLLGVINFAHGAMYMLGAYGALLAAQQLGIGYGWALVLSPLVVGVLGMVIERSLLARLRQQDHLYGLLLTLGLALMIEGSMREHFGLAGAPYPMPAAFVGALNLGFLRLPYYRAWVIVAALGSCLGTWWVIERTRLGSALRAATENRALSQALGLNVPRMVTLTFGAGAALAALAGVLAAPMVQVSPLMGSHLLVVVFAVVVIGGTGSILGAVFTGLLVGVLEGVCKVVFPVASAMVVFVLMVGVLLLRPQGLFTRRG